MNQKLIILTGAPASGKRTLAKIMSNEYVKLFHNHLTVDLALSLFPFGSKPYVELCEILRKDCITFAFTNKIKCLIFTFCYEGNIDFPFLEALEGIADRLNVLIKYIHLQCDRETLLSRVSNKDRSNFGKITNKEKLLEILNSWSCENPIPNKKSIILNNSKLTVDESVETISEIISTLDYE